MSQSVRVLASLATLALILAAAPAVLAGRPTHEIVRLDDPAIDVEESAWASGFCGFEIVADVGGHIGLVATDGTGHVLELNLYAIRASYTNPETGATFNYRDIGPDRAFVKDGRVYVAVTGRSSGSGVIGVVIIDIATGDIVHQAGNDVGDFYAGMCEALGG